MSVISWEVTSQGPLLINVVQFDFVNELLDRAINSQQPVDMLRCIFQENVSMLIAFCWL